MAKITINKNGVDVNRKALQKAHRRSVFQTHEHRVSENGTHTFFTHCWSLQVWHHKDHPEMHQHTTFVIVANRARDERIHTESNFSLKKDETLKQSQWIIYHWLSNAAVPQISDDSLFVESGHWWCSVYTGYLSGIQMFRLESASQSFSSKCMQSVYLLHLPHVVCGLPLIKTRSSQHVGTLV